MTTFLILFLFILLTCAAAWIFYDRGTIHRLHGEVTRERTRAEVAVERMHAVGDSALRGFPAVQWRRPYPVPEGADAWYWRVRVAGEELLLTDEAFRTARQRADHLLPGGREVTSRVEAKSEAPAGGPA